MRIVSAKIHNFRSILDAQIDLHEYSLLVGANNAGKSNLVSALRVFFDDLKPTQDDFPTVSTADQESWIELSFKFTDTEQKALSEQYRRGDKALAIRKVLRAEEKERVKANQSNLYAVGQNGDLENQLFYGAKNVGQARLGEVLYIPSVSIPTDHMKTSGPSALRDTLNFLLKRSLVESQRYRDLAAALRELSDEGQRQGGFFARVTDPLNEALEDWGIRIGLTLDELSPEDLTKNLLRSELKDTAAGGAQFAVDRYGQGFQRALIYQLLRLAADLKPRVADKNTFRPEFTLILFEEPENFLHPHQQVRMAQHLRGLGAEPTQQVQVVVTSHSPHFASRSADRLTSLIRVHKQDGASQVRQLSAEDVKDVFHDGLALATCLQKFVDDSRIDDGRKGHARKMLNELPKEEVAEQEEAFRHQLWLDGERTSMLFADHVVIVEGATEKALMEYLMSENEEWKDLGQLNVYVLDAQGKFNIHRHMALLNRLGISFSVLMDGDQGHGVHAAVNEMVEARCKECGCKLHVWDKDLESVVLDPQAVKRSDKKPIAMLTAVAQGKVSNDKLKELRNVWADLTEQEVHSDADSCCAGQGVK